MFIVDIIHSTLNKEQFITECLIWVAGIYLLYSRCVSFNEGTFQSIMDTPNVLNG